MAVEKHPRGMNLSRPFGHRRQAFFVVNRTGSDLAYRGHGQGDRQAALGQIKAARRSKDGPTAIHGGTLAFVEIHVSPVD